MRLWYYLICSAGRLIDDMLVVCDRYIRGCFVMLWVSLSGASNITIAASQSWEQDVAL